MEEILPLLKKMFQESIETQYEKENLTIILKVKKEVKGKLADKEEVIIMLKMFGGLQEDLPMEIIIDQESQIIKIILQSEEHFEKLKDKMLNIWENTVELLSKTIQGDYSEIKDIPNIDD